MKIFFIGCVEFSYLALQKLISMHQDGIRVVGIATKQDSAFNADFCDLAPLGRANHIPTFYADDINSIESMSFIESCSPDVIYCFGWSSLIKKSLLDKYPIVGYHPASLPFNRGRHPLIWALVLGMDKSASTFFIMDSGADSGDILSQVPVCISYFDTAKTLYDKFSSIALDQIEQFSKEIINKLNLGGGGAFVPCFLQLQLRKIYHKQTYGESEGCVMV